jgi:hypothetical protein
MKCRAATAFPWARAEVEQPVRTLDDLPASPNLDDGEVRAVEGDAILAGQLSRRGATSVREPVHHRRDATAQRPADEAERGELVVVDDLDRPLGFPLTGAHVEHPVAALRHLPAAADLDSGNIGSVEGDAVPGNEGRVNHLHRVAGDAQPRPDGVLP